jgi:uracil-DNA glycosylase family 4
MNSRLCNRRLSQIIGSRMDQTKLSRAEAWLRYADDLNLGPYYRNRSQSSSQSSAQSDVAQVAIAEPPQAELRTVVAVAPRSSSGTPAAPAQSAAQSKKGAPVISPVAAPTIDLFAEKIDNDSLERIRSDIGPDCTRCKLHKARTNIVFGVGNPKAELMFVGEGPGHDEDLQGEPFVGRAGKLLTQMIIAMGLRRSDVYIANVVKCRPPENRLPEKDEIATCSPYLLRQIAVIAPKVIVCLGACSAQTLLQTTQGISKFRGEWFDFLGAKLMATYHPAYLLRNPPAKSEVWKDLQKVMAHLGLEVKKR